MEFFIGIAVGVIGTFSFIFIVGGLISSKEDIPEFKLEPNGHGEYSLQRWNCNVDMYLTEAIVKDKKEAQKVIDNLKRKSEYYHDE